MASIGEREFWHILARASAAMPHFPRKRFGWGPPATWQGGVFLFLWMVSVAAATSGERTAGGLVLLLGLMVFLLYVLWTDSQR